MQVNLRNTDLGVQEKCQLRNGVRLLGHAKCQFEVSGPEFRMRLVRMIVCFSPQRTEQCENEQGVIGGLAIAGV